MVRRTDRPAMTIAVAWDVKQHNKQTNFNVNIGKESPSYMGRSLLLIHSVKMASTRARSAVGNVSGYRCVSDCRSRGLKFDPGPVPYFRDQ